MSYTFSKLIKKSMLLGFCGLSLFANSVLAQADQKQILTKDLYNIEGQCLFNLANIIYSRGPIKSGFPLRSESMRLYLGSQFAGTVFETKEFRFVTPLKQVRRDQMAPEPCSASISSSWSFRGSDRQGTLKKLIFDGTGFPNVNSVSIDYNLNDTCVAKENTGKFSVYLNAVPFFLFSAKPKFERNGFGAVVASGDFYAEEFSIDLNEGEGSDQSLRSEIVASTQGESYFRYPKSEYLSCLRTGLTKLGVTPKE